VSLHEHLLDTGRITLNVREAGDGPLAVFMHGITANGAVWEPVLERLAGSFRVVSLDQRGHGRSDKPAEGYTGADFAADLLAVIETLGGGAPALAVGHSLGARNGIVAAAARPDLISGVVAVDFTPYIEPEVLETLAMRVRGGDRTFETRQSIVDYLSERYPRMPADAVERRATHGYVETEQGFRPLADPNSMSQTAEGLKEDLEPATRDVKRPVLMIRGAESTLVSETAFDRTRTLRPDLEYLVVPGTDHYVPEEAPDVISDAVLRFAQGLG
jgi:2-(acetamidomethylene)succinate hydrolase